MGSALCSPIRRGMDIDKVDTQVGWRGALWTRNAPLLTSQSAGC